MLRIRRKQLDALGAQSAADFVARATAAVLAWKVPRFEGVDPGEVASWVRERTERAYDFGLDDERTLLGWLEVGATWGDDFAEDAFVTHLLAEPGATDDWPATWDVLEGVAAATLDPDAAPSEDAT